jgi:hypothetical protein
VQKNGVVEMVLAPLRGDGNFMGSSKVTRAKVVAEGVITTASIPRLGKL